MLTFDAVANVDGGGLRKRRGEGDGAALAAAFHVSQS